MLITGSIVLYHNQKNEIQRVIDSFFNYKGKSKLILIDNSSNDELSLLNEHENIIYHYNKSNIGYGSAHNLAFEIAYRLNSKYHLVLNPDVYFKSNTIEIILNKFKNDKSIGLISPKILYPNGEIQYSCKLIPTPFDLFIRRFIPLNFVQKSINFKYELRNFEYNKEIEVPIVSGCFMFVRTAYIKKINGFDERFFMYMEDVDLSRKLRKIGKIIFYPKAEITHTFEKGSYKNYKLLKYHIISAIKYFNKWGWFFDTERKQINKNTLNQ